MTKAAGRNIAFKAVKMNETALKTQAASVTRGVGEKALPREHESLEDLGRYADLRFYFYIFNHEVAQN